MVNAGQWNVLWNPVAAKKGASCFKAVSSSHGSTTDSDETSVCHFLPAFTQGSERPFHPHKIVDLNTPRQINVKFHGMNKDYLIYMYLLITMFIKCFLFMQIYHYYYYSTCSFFKAGDVTATINPFSAVLIFGMYTWLY